MKFVKGNFKFEGMRKEQEFIIYPCLPTDAKVKLQSDTRMVMVDIHDGKAMMSKPCPGGAYMAHLQPQNGGHPIFITITQLDRIREMHKQMSGATNEDRTLTISAGRMETINV